MQSPWKNDFPALRKTNHQTPIIYLDSAATCQVPNTVIEAVSQYLTNGQGNAGRGMHGLSESATSQIQSCRNKVAELIGCKNEQVVFTKGATESINLVAASMRNSLNKSDSILVTALEHHSNLLPWQRLCQQTGATLNVLPINSSGDLILDQLDNFLQQNCKLLAMTHCSNVLGNHPPLETLIDKAKQFKVKTLIDGAQAISHTTINLDFLQCNYYAFSGHKLYAPGGSGVLYCKDHQTLEPLLLGGGIVTKTSLDKYSLIETSGRLEAGSANLVALVGLSAAIDYVRTIGFDKIKSYEKRLSKYLYSSIKNKTNFKIVSHQSSSSLVSFTHPVIHCHDVASLLAERGIAVRAGHHCAQPCLLSIGVKHCVRASIGLYNDSNDVDQLVLALQQIESTFS